MPSVSFTNNLKRFYPDLATLNVDSRSIPEILEQIDSRHPGIKDYILDEQGRLRKHVNIFIGNDLIRDRDNLSDIVDDKDEIYIMQALSGG